MSKSQIILGFQNIKKEIHDPIELEIKGNIPDWVQGSLYRNGPGIYDVKTNHGTTWRVGHWFDGLTVIHKFTIDGKKVTYQNRRMVPKIEEYIVQNGSSPDITFGIDPCKTMFQKITSVFIRQKPIDESNAGVTIGYLNDKLISKTDANVFLEIDPETLELQALMTYASVDPKLTGPLSAAHSQTDFETGEFFNFTTDLGRAATYNVFSASKNGSRILASYPASAAYIHSFGLTKNYLIMIHWPLDLTPISMVTTQTLEKAMQWNGDKDTIFVVIDRNNDKIVGRYRTPSFYAFHTINGFEQDGNIILDIATYDNADIVLDLRMSKIDDPHHQLTSGQARRFILPDVASLSESEIRSAEQIELHRGTFELPRFNQNYHLKPYRYAYAIAHVETDAHWNSIMKLDVTTKETKVWKVEGMYPGEAIFVPDPNGKDEDDGVLMSVVLNANLDRSDLIVLNAKTMEEMGRAEVPFTVPFGFHGNFIAPSSRSDQ
eukprot:TRINITY_DN15211_c0_g1_i1.p1 TRINITY_DN15211_c0_g1~~TRINITY_DN15211_c0_g1_i1.p1  ORF type:complete len:490 (-),score=143.09 TRINITY_DN15211_c0_g1_i1:18-1487(-)